MRFASAADAYFLLVAVLISAARALAPLRLRAPLVRAVSEVAHRLSHTRREGGRRGVTAAFGAALGEREVERVVRRSFYEFWRDTLEMLPYARDLGGEGVETRGLDRLREALARGTGVILWESSFFGRRMRAKHLLSAAGFAVHQVHSEEHIGGLYAGPARRSWLRRRVLEPLFERYERRSVAGIVTLPRSESLAFGREIMERLRRNEIICIAADAQIGRRLIPVRFLNRVPRLSPGMPSLARQSGATILPIFCFTDDSGRTVLTVEAAIDVRQGGGREQALRAALAQYVSLLESYVRAHPEQYRNWPSFDPAPRPAGGVTPAASAARRTP